TAGACARDHVRHPSLRLVPDLGAGRLVVRLGVRGVIVLIEVHRVGDLRREPPGHRIVRTRVVRSDGGRAHDDLGPERAQDGDLFFALLVRARNNAAVTPSVSHAGEYVYSVAAR